MYIFIISFHFFFFCAGAAPGGVRETHCRQAELPIPRGQRRVLPGRDRTSATRDHRAGEATAKHRDRLPPGCAQVRLLAFWILCVHNLFIAVMLILLNVEATFDCLFAPELVLFFCSV